MLKAIWGYNNDILTLTLLSVTTVSMLFSLVMYFILFVGLVREKNKADMELQECQAEEGTD